MLYFFKEIKHIVMQQNCLRGEWWCLLVFNIFFSVFKKDPLSPFLSLLGGGDGCVFSVGGRPVNPCDRGRCGGGVFGLFPLSLPSLSPISPLSLPYLSPLSPLSLPYLSPLSPLSLLSPLSFFSLSLSLSLFSRSVTLVIKRCYGPPTTKVY